MTLLDLFKKYSADELLATIDEMFPDTEKFHNTFREAYNLMMTLTPIASKKKITYKILSDEENDIEFSELKTAASTPHGRCVSPRN